MSCSPGGVYLAIVERTGVARVAAYRWFHAGVLPVRAGKVGRLILVGVRSAAAGPPGWTAVCAPVSSADQGTVLDRQVAGVTGWATGHRTPVDRVVTEVGSALNGHRRRFLALLRDTAVGRIVVEHRHRFCRFGSGYVHVAVTGQGGELVVVDTSEVDDDLVRDMTEVLTSMGARWSGKPAAANRPGRALAAAAAAEAV